jgi:hypothetical protein
MNSLEESIRRLTDLKKKGDNFRVKNYNDLKKFTLTLYDIAILISDSDFPEIFFTIGDFHINLASIPKSDVHMFYITHLPTEKRAHLWVRDKHKETSGYEYEEKASILENVAIYKMFREELPYILENFLNERADEAEYKLNEKIGFKRLLEV